MSMRFVVSRQLAARLVVVSCALAIAATWSSVPAWAAVPTVEDESFADVGSSSARLHATIDAEGLPSAYHFEYGTTASPYTQSTPAASLGSTSQGVGVIAQVQGLTPNTLYHFRVVASNEDGNSAGLDAAFDTLPAGLLGLPDGRGYEMVTPVENEDAEIYVPPGAADENEEAIKTAHPVRAAADGDAVTYVGEPTSGGNGSTGSGEGNEYIATRGPQGGWIQQDIQPPGDASAEYWGFSSDLSAAVLTSREPLASGIASKYEVPYTRAANGTLQPFFTVAPPNRAPGEFKAVTDEGYLRAVGEFYAGASANFADQLFEVNDALTPEAVDGGIEANNLYESVDGQLQLVNVLPDGKSEPNASFGARPKDAEGAGDFSRTISADGSRVFWTDLNTETLYVREGGATTKLIAEHATFWTASADGSRVLYTKGGDLYSDDLETGVTSDLAPNGEVEGVAGASEDGEYVYFVADASLAPGATAGEPNLYLHHAGVTAFIATLSPHEDLEEFYGNGIYNNVQWNIGYRTAQVTPDGQALVFMSNRSLTGYDNNVGEAFGAYEVYIYQATDGDLACISCDPSGAPPPAGSALAAGYLPVSRAATYQPRVISEAGDRVFFEASVPLVPQDTNGSRDVYEWKRDGSGDCRTSSGCVDLLSGGTSRSASYLIDAGANGDDVFIDTRAQLAPQDQNEYYDVYDARVGAVAPPAPSQCTGTGCQGVPLAPPVFATPASVTFEGIGNFSAPTPSVKPASASKKAKSKHRQKRHPTSKKKSSKRRHTVKSRATRALRGAREAKSTTHTRRHGRGRNGR